MKEVDRDKMERMSLEDLIEMWTEVFWYDYYKKIIEEETASGGTSLTVDWQTLDAIDNVFRKLGGDCLGVVKEDYGQVVTDVGKIDELVKILIEQRNEARKRKDFAAADVIRDKLSQANIVLEDKPGQTVWRKK